MAVVKKSAEKYTYSSYLTWPDDERWEIIAGEAYNMSPAPSIKHQNVVVNLSSYLKQQLRGKSCRPFVAPTDVVLSDYDVVQPDIKEEWKYIIQGQTIDELIIAIVVKLSVTNKMLIITVYRDE